MLRPFLYLFICVASSVVFAEVLIEHEPVLVEASKPFLDEADADYLSGHVSIISREDFDTKVATVADVLRNETGVQVRQVGGLGSFSTINIRGSNSRQVNVYLNGVLLNGAFGGAVDLSQFSLDNVERIEVYRGNAPVTLGFSGIGGAVNIKTRDFNGKPIRQIKIGLGSLESENFAVSIADRIQENDIFLSAEYLAAENNFGFKNNNLTPSFVGDDFLDRRNNADFEQFTGLLSLKRELNEKVVIGWVAQYFDKGDSFPNVHNSESNFALLDTQFFSTQAKLNYQFSRDLTFGFKVSVSDKKEHYLDQGSSVGLNVNDEENNSANYGLEVLSEYSLGSHLFSFSLDTKVEDYSKRDYIENTLFEYQRKQSVFGLQDEWLSDDGDFQLNFGWRYFFLRDKAELISKRDSRNYHNAQVGLKYTLNRDIQFHSNISRNIRIPQLFELYGDRGLFIGNDELLPETALNADLGVRVDLKRFVSKSSIYYRYLKDGIFLSYSSQGIGRAINLSRSRVIGFESDNSFEVTNYLSAQLKTTVQNSEEISRSRDRDGNSLPGLYTLANTASLKVSARPMVYGIEYRHQSGGFFDASNAAEIPSQDQINVSARWSNQASSLEFSVDNIADSRFLDFNRYPLPGRRLVVVFKTQI